MKAKTSAAFFVALLFFATQLSLRAQTPDCYDIVCPSKVLAPCEGVFGAHAWFSVTVSNRCPALPTPTVTYSIPPGSLFPPGTTVVCAVIQIPGVAARQCCFEVIVDGCCPSNCLDLICPSNIVVNCQASAGVLGAFVDLPKPQVTNQCGDHLLPATVQVRCTPQVSTAGGAVFFPPGTNTVVCCMSGDTAATPLKCCCFQVIVEGCPVVTDQCQPQLLCPKETQVSCTGSDGAIVFFPPPRVFDPCGLVVATNCTHVSGTFFPNGKTTVACCITWKNPTTGTLATECCCFEVVVRCCPPTNCVTTLVCPTNLVLECPGIITNYPVFGTNNCEPTRLICDPPPGTAISGSITVCCKLVNASGIVLTQCCFNVTVVDTTPPVIACPHDITVTSPDCQPVPVPLPVVTAIDNCDPNPIVKCSPVSTALFPCGTTTITCKAVDASGNATNCSFNVTVICRPGEIVCPPDMLFTCASPTGVVVTYTVTVTNGCLPVTAIVCYPPSGSVFLPGSYAVCCTNRTSAIGATANICCFKVRVVPDDIPPTILCPSNIVVLTPNCVPIDVPYPLPTATDNCQLDSVVCLPPPGSVFPLGTTVVTCCATDKAGNSNCCAFKVTVRCPDCLRMVCPSNIVVECAGRNGAVVSYKAYGTNLCTGVEVPVNCTPPSGSVFPPGLTQVCCTNAPSPVNSTIGVCCFTITVRPDTTPPVITCPSNIVTISPNCAAIEVFYAAPTATDDCQLDSVICTPKSGSLFPIGITTVTCCATDKSGNSNCCSFTVTVRCLIDCIRVVCPSNIVIECADPNGVPAFFKAYATNVCTKLELPAICTPPSGSVFPPGVTQVCCTNVAINLPPVGTVNYCCFTVTVRPDTIPPVILCPSNIVVTSANCAPIDVLYPQPTATDNCQLDSITCTPPSGSPFPLGTTVVTCCAVDKAGNTNCCSFKVTVRCPNDCIRVVCPSNILVECAGPNGAFVKFEAYGTNFCTGGIFPVLCSVPAGSFFPIGTTTVCCSNALTGTVPLWCCFDVTVKPDTQPPVINCSSNLVILCARPIGAKVNYVVTASDNCDPAPTLTCVPPSGSLFRLGCTNVTCTAVDRAGNASTCTFKVCVLRQGCYLRNPSFEVLDANLPLPLNCGDPIAFALGWSALAGTPDLFRPPFASLVPGNCRGVQNPCQGTNYAGLEGGYTTSGGFVTEEMMGTLIAPLNNGQRFRLRSCLSLAESSTAPVLIEFVLANSANLAQQQVIHQVLVVQKKGWLQYQPPCFLVPRIGTWDRLIIRASQAGPNQHRYPVGYVYVDNVNICCCKPELGTVVIGTTTVSATWDGAGQLQGCNSFGDPMDWHDITSPVEMDPDTGLYHTTFPRPDMNMFFRIVGPETTTECAECGDGG